MDGWYVRRATFDAVEKERNEYRYVFCQCMNELCDPIFIRSVQSPFEYISNFENKLEKIKQLIEKIKDSLKPCANNGLSTIYQMIDLINSQLIDEIAKHIEISNILRAPDGDACNIIGFIDNNYKKETHYIRGQLKFAKEDENTLPSLDSHIKTSIARIHECVIALIERFGKQRETSNTIFDDIICLLSAEREASEMIDTILKNRGSNEEMNNGILGKLSAILEKDKKESDRLDDICRKLGVSEECSTIDERLSVIESNLDQTIQSLHKHISDKNGTPEDLLPNTTKGCMEVLKREEDKCLKLRNRVFNALGGKTNKRCFNDIDSKNSESIEKITKGIAESAKFRGIQSRSAVDSVSGILSFDAGMLHEIRTINERYGTKPENCDQESFLCQYEALKRNIDTDISERDAAFSSIGIICGVESNPNYCTGVGHIFESAQTNISELFNRLKGTIQSNGFQDSNSDESSLLGVSNTIQAQFGDINHRLVSMVEAYGFPEAKPAEHLCDNLTVQKASIEELRKSIRGFILKSKSSGICNMTEREEHSIDEMRFSDLCAYLEQIYSNICSKLKEYYSIIDQDNRLKEQLSMTEKIATNSLVAASNEFGRRMRILKEIHQRELEELSRHPD